MKNKITGLVITALLAVVISTGFATVAQAAQVSIKPTGKFKMLEDRRLYGSYKKDVPDSMVQSKDGTYVVTVHEKDTIALQFKITKGYIPMIYNEDGHCSWEPSGEWQLNTKLSSDYLPLYVSSSGHSKPVVKTYTFRAAKYNPVKGGKMLLFYGPAVKIKVIVRPNIETGTFLRNREVQFIEALNVDRVARGLNPVVQTPEAQAYAETRAMELFTYEVSHRRPSGLEKEAYDEVVMLSGVHCTGSLDFSEFKQSPGHYASLSQSDVSEFGIACYAYGEAVYVCADLRTDPTVDGWDPTNGWGE